MQMRQSDHSSPERQWFSLSSRFWIVFASWVICLFFLLFQGGKTSFMLLCMMTILCIYLWIGKWSGISKSKGVRKLLYAGENRAIFYAGDTIEAELTVKVQMVGMAPYVMLRDQLIRRNGETLTFESLVIPNRNRNCVMKYKLPHLKRGFYSFGTSECAMEDVFGWFQHTGAIQVDSQFCVLPQTIRIPRWRMIDLRNQGYGRHAMIHRSSKETTQINGVREYIHGDRISRIHWSATAKTGQWKSKEFERESLPSMVLVLDRTQRHYATEEQFELAVSVAASLLEYSREHHIPVGLISLGKSVDFFPPGSTALHHKEIKNHLIDTNADGYADLTGQLQPYQSQTASGSFYVVISPGTNDSVLRLLQWLQHKQMTVSQVLVMFSQPGSAEGWSTLLLSQSIAVYPVQRLQELPIVLGGWSNGPVAAHDLTKS